MACSKDISVLVRAIRRAGGRVVQARSGHFKVYWEGRYVGSLPVSSSDVRAIHNAKSHFRKQGLPV